MYSALAQDSVPMKEGSSPWNPPVAWDTLSLSSSWPPRLKSTTSVNYHPSTPDSSRNPFHVTCVIDDRILLVRDQIKSHYVLGWRSNAFFLDHSWDPHHMRNSLTASRSAIYVNQISRISAQTTWIDVTDRSISVSWSKSKSFITIFWDVVEGVGKSQLEGMWSPKGYQLYASLRKW